MKMDWFHAVYESIEEFVAASLPRYGEYFDAEWTGGVTSHDEARRLAERGWKEGVERMRRMGLDMEDAVQSMGLEGLMPVEQHDVCGATVDVGLFCEGEPECMVEYEEQVMPDSRVVRMFVQINYLGRVGADQSMHRGVAIAAVIDALETTGLQVEVWAVDCTESIQVQTRAALEKEEDHRLYRHAVRIKNAGEPLPTDRLAFAVGHPAFYRGLSFGVRGNVQGSNRGTSQPIPDHVKAPGELVVPMLTPEAADEHFDNDESAAAWACETFESMINNASEEAFK